MPASEPESVLIVDAIENYSPDLIIQMHQPFNTIYPDINVNTDLIQIMSDVTGIEISYNIGYDTPGSLGSYKSSLNYDACEITFELCGIDREPDYGKITESLIEAINFKRPCTLEE